MQSFRIKGQGNYSEQRLASPLREIMGFAVINIEDKLILKSGGHDTKFCEYFDIKSGVWRATRSFYELRSGHSMTFVG